MMMRANRNILCILTTRQSNLGTVRVTMSRAVKELSETA
jgi:predicted regulator of Ras-like GTPase activity (Roadblock/LC7/MglB family)